ncbi:hypothetical protein TNCV_2533881 [Trichonephila clavipes]|nr:hypothetical protein TNCV_2533881 [Trichonephila clavipes]
MEYSEDHQIHCLGQKLDLFAQFWLRTSFLLPGYEPTSIFQLGLSNIPQWTLTYQWEFPCHQSKPPSVLSMGRLVVDHKQVESAVPTLYSPHALRMSWSSESWGYPQSVLEGFSQFSSEVRSLISANNCWEPSLGE